MNWISSLGDNVLAPICSIIKELKQLHNKYSLSASKICLYYSYIANALRYIWIGMISMV